MNRDEFTHEMAVDQWQAAITSALKTCARQLGARVSVQWNDVSELGQVTVCYDLHYRIRRLKILVALLYSIAVVLCSCGFLLYLNQIGPEREVGSATFAVVIIAMITDSYASRVVPPTVDKILAAATEALAPHYHTIIKRCGGNVLELCWDHTS